MATIKEQKLSLYIQFLQQSDRTHFIIQGLTKEQRAREEKRMYEEHHSKVTEVPKHYTLAKLQSLVY
jgi:hypothetical protein